MTVKNLTLGQSTMGLCATMSTLVNSQFDISEGHVIEQRPPLRAVYRTGFFGRK